MYDLDTAGDYYIVFSIAPSAADSRAAVFDKIIYTLSRVAATAPHAKNMQTPHVIFRNNELTVDHNTVVLCAWIFDTNIQ